MHAVVAGFGKSDLKQYLKTFLGCGSMFENHSASVQRCIASGNGSKDMRANEDLSVSRLFLSMNTCLISNPNLIMLVIITVH